MVDEEQVFNAIRDQIDRINQDFNKYELESSQTLLRKRQEDEQRNRRMAELEELVQAGHLQQLKLTAQLNDHQAALA
jgi:hypothetical protein